MSMKYIFTLPVVWILLSSGYANAQSETFIDIAKGGNQICGITSAQQLLCSTSPSASRLIPPNNLPSLSQVGVGDAHACALDLNGAAFCWGDNDFNQLNVPENYVFTSIDVGWNHTCATTADWETVCWGLSHNNRLEVPIDGLPFIETDASLTHSCGLEAAGGIRCWGGDNFRWDPPGAHADIETFAATATHFKPNLCALISGGRIECTSGSYQFPDTYTDVAAWGQAVCALDTEGNLICQATSAAQAQEIARLNERAPFKTITSHLGLCAIDEAGDIACTSSALTASTGVAQRALDSLALPGKQPTAVPAGSIEAVDDIRAAVYSPSVIELFWTSYQRAGIDLVVGAQIYRNNEFLVETSNSSSYIDRTLQPGVDYEYEVRILSSSGAVGPMGRIITVNTLGDRIVVSGYKPPERSATPANLIVVDNSSTEMELLWDRPSASAGVYGYEVYRNNQFLGFTAGYDYIDSNDLSTRHDYYVVVAVNRDGSILGVASASLDL